MAGSGERKSKKDDNGIGTAIDFVLSNARLVLGVGGAAMLGIATLAVKRVSALRPGQARPGIGEVVRLPSGADLEEDRVVDSMVFTSIIVMDRYRDRYFLYRSVSSRRLSGSRSMSSRKRLVATVSPVADQLPAT